MTGDEHSARVTWAQWVNARFDEYKQTKGHDLKQLDVAYAVRVGNSTVTKWRKAVGPAEADIAVRMARYFGRPFHEALRAAGHDEIADLLDPALAPLPSTDASDPVAEEIMGWTHFTVDVRRTLLEGYRDDMRTAAERVRRTAELLKARGENR